MQAAELPIPPSAESRGFREAYAAALAAILPRTTIAGRLRGLGLSVVARDTPLILGSAEIGRYQAIKPAEDGGFTRIDSGEGSGAHWVDRQMLEYLQSTAPQPTQLSLNRLMEKVRHVRVISGGVVDHTQTGHDVLLEFSDETSLRALRELLLIADGSGGHCMCIGDPTLELLGANGDRIGLIGLHHGMSIRSPDWKDDARLLDGREFAGWLAGRGVPGPLDELEGKIKPK